MCAPPPVANAKYSRVIESPSHPVVEHAVSRSGETPRPPTPSRWVRNAGVPVNKKRNPDAGLRGGSPWCVTCPAPGLRATLVREARWGHCSGLRRTRPGHGVTRRLECAGPAGQGMVSELAGATLAGPRAAWQGVLQRQLGAADRSTRTGRLGQESGDRGVNPFRSGRRLPWDPYREEVELRPPRGQEGLPVAWRFALEPAHHRIGAVLEGQQAQRIWVLPGPRPAA